MNLAFLKKLTGLINKDNIVVILVMAVAVLVFLNLQQCGSKATLKKEIEFEKKITQQNMLALLDSIHAVKNKVGETEFDKAAYIADMKQLKELNKGLYDEIKKVKGEVISLINSKVQGTVKPIETTNSVIKYDDLTYGLKSHINESEPGFSYKMDIVSKFKLNDNKIYPDSTSVSNHTFTLDLTYGFKETDDKYEVFAKSASPSISINQLEGVLILPKKKDVLCPPEKKKRWGIGPSVVGYYNFGTGKPSVNVGFGIQYNVIRF